MKKEASKLINNYSKNNRIKTLIYIFTLPAKNGSIRFKTLIRKKIISEMNDNKIYKFTYLVGRSNYGNIIELWKTTRNSTRKNEIFRRYS